MRVINIEDRLPSKTVATPLQAIELALNEIEVAEFPPDDAIIILHSVTYEDEYYQILAGGDVTNESLLWHLEQVKRVILETEE